MGEKFESLLGKEKPGPVRCYGRTMTPTMFKRHENIASIKKEYEAKMSSMQEEMNGMKAMMKFMLKQQNPELDDDDDDDINELMTCLLGKESNATRPHSSASTYNPNSNDYQL